ncbi:MAG: iron ABC transporter permease [Synergistaceae bacterium]|jgi:iron complex transport system permease protein|nr:iron ABC transporter permease [Synergistaceae bacterium]
MAVREHFGAAGKGNGSRVFGWLFFAAAPIVCILISLTIGQYPISTKDIFRILIGRALGMEADWPALMETLLLNVRLPRIMASALIGAALSASGAAFQAIFRNPLASPYTLGVSNGAGFGAAMAVMFFGSAWSIQILATLGGVVSVVMAFILSGRARYSAIALVLAGIIVGAFFSSLISMVKFIADPYEKLPAIVFWLMGSLATVNLGSLFFATPFFLAGMVVLLAYRWKLNVLSMGDEEAASFGIDVARERVIVIFCCTILTAAAVSISGIIGWVGLVIPHLGRAIVGPDLRKLLPACISLGASYLLVIDDLCRALTSVEIPLGVVTAIVGAPIFGYFMMREKTGW